MMATSLPPANAATTFTVNSTADTPDASTASNTCDTDVFTGGDQCTLRAAIQQANATAGADAINFAIPGTGVKTIAVGATGLGRLPAITDPVTINGYTQPGASPNTLAVGDNAVLKIELAGNGATGTALEITHVSGSSVIKGLVINRFGDGIDVHGDTVGNRIEGNFIGTDHTGTIDKGNTDDGVNIFDGASGNVVGGTTPAARNVISGNACNAVFFKRATGNLVQGNYIGTDKTGTKGLANGDGLDCVAVVIDDSSGNTVGGATSGARNLVSGNKLDGVGILGDSQDNKLLGNRIGTTANGTGALGNGEAGVLLQGSINAVGDGTAAGSNTIAFNAEDGVQVQSGAGHKISRNSIFSNAELGIDLQGGFEDAAGNTANDPGDIDTGANGLQNKPVISSAKTVSSKTTITGKLSSRPNSGYDLRFYSNPSGNEGKKFIGQKFVKTDGSGNASFTFSPTAAVSKGQTVTATATSVNLDASNGDTSEFSAPKTVGLSGGSALSPETTKISGPSGVTKSQTAHFKFSSPVAGATFECSLDGGAYYECSSPENIYRLSEGRHTFLVRAVDGEGNVDLSPAQWIWAVDRTN
jgi:CSLREA domain-containing protein